MKPLENNEYELMIKKECCENEYEFKILFSSIFLIYGTMNKHFF